MPYMPTNMSPNNISLVKGEDIVFHCMIDKYDTITRAKLTLYNYYNKEESGFVEIGYSNNQTILLSSSNNLNLNLQDSSTLPFIASKYEVPVFSIGILGTSTLIQKSSINDYGYNIEFYNDDVYDRWVLEGNIDTIVPQLITIEDDSQSYNTLHLYVYSSPLFDDLNQKIYNRGSKQGYPFVVLNEYYEHKSHVQKWVDQKTFVLKDKINYVSNENVYVCDFANIRYSSWDTNTYQIVTDVNGSYITVNGKKVELKEYSSIPTALSIYFEAALSCFPELELKDAKSMVTYYPKIINMTTNDIQYSTNDNLLPDLILRFNHKNGSVNDFYYGAHYYFNLFASNKEGFSSNLEYFSIQVYKHKDDTYSGELKQTNSFYLYEHSSGPSALVANIDGVEYDIVSIGDNEQVTIEQNYIGKTDIIGQFVIIYQKYMVLQVTSEFVKTIDTVKKLTTESDNQEISSLTELQFKWIKNNKNDPNYYLVINNNNEIDIGTFNKYSFYYLKDDVYINLGKLQRVTNEDNNIGLYKYYFPSSKVGYSLLPDRDEENFCQIYIDDYKVSENEENLFNHFEIYSNQITSSDNIFSLIDNNKIHITENIKNGAYRKYSGSVLDTINKNTIDYSQWTLKKNNKIINQSKKIYAKIEDYQYNFFKPNSEYTLTLKIHDKRSIDWEESINIVTEKEFKEIKYNLDTAAINDKNVEIDISKSSDFTPNGNNGWTLLKNDINYPVGDFIISFQFSGNETDVIQFQDRESNYFDLSWSNEEKYIFKYGGLEAIDLEFYPDSEYWIHYKSKEKTLLIVGGPYNQEILKHENIKFENFYDIYLESGVYNYKILMSVDKIEIEEDNPFPYSSLGFSWSENIYFVYQYGNNRKLISPADNFLIQRRELELVDGKQSQTKWLNTSNTTSQQDKFVIKNIITLCTVDKNTAKIKDYSAGQGKFYQYEIIPLANDIDKTYITNIIDTNDWYEINIFGTKSYYKNNENSQYEVDADNLWTFELNADANNITFNAVNTPNDGASSRYPKITSSYKNYLSGSGSMYLGTLDNNYLYSRDSDNDLIRFSEFANNNAVKFLKLKNGMVIPVSITLKSSENSANLIGNPTKINFDWVQIDDLNASLTEVIKEV